MNGAVCSIVTTPAFAAASAISSYDPNGFLLPTGLYRWYATTGRYTGPEISDGAAFGFEDLLTSFPGQS